MLGLFRKQELEDEFEWFCPKCKEWYAKGGFCRLHPTTELKSVKFWTRIFN